MLRFSMHPNGLVRIDLVTFHRILHSATTRITRLLRFRKIRKSGLATLCLLSTLWIILNASKCPYWEKRYGPESKDHEKQDTTLSSQQIPWPRRRFSHWSSQIQIVIWISSCIFTLARTGRAYSIPTSLEITRTCLRPEKWILVRKLKSCIDCVRE